MTKTRVYTGKVHEAIAIRMRTSLSPWWYESHRPLTFSG